MAKSKNSVGSEEPSSSRPRESYHTVYTNAKAGSIFLVKLKLWLNMRILCSMIGIIGMEGVDKEKVQRIVYEMSKGSKYFENEEKKEVYMKQKIKNMHVQYSKLTAQDISHHQKVVKEVAILAGVCATDPFRRMDNFLKQMESVGFCGVQNFPTVGLFDGNFRQNLEETGMGYGLEVEMITTAHRMGLLTTPYAFCPDEAIVMAEAGADLIVAYMGLTTSGSIGAKTAVSLEESYFS